VKITAKRQVTLPAAVLEALGVGPGDRLELQDGPQGFVLRPQRIDFANQAPLRARFGATPVRSTWRTSVISRMTRASGLILRSR
jgi:AbrB family looped-hinge helix DNA binding protein